MKQLPAIAIKQPFQGFSFSNRRSRTLLLIALCIVVLGILLLGTYLIGNEGLDIALASRNQPPSLTHPFGTDWLGRDMATRTLHGLSLSLWVGLLTASFSAIFALAIGTLSSTLGGKVDAVITWLIDVALSLPHLVLIILVAFAAGGGVRGLLLAIIITHWMSLARLLRAEVLQLKSSDYVQLSAKFGRSPLWIARHHLLPHLMPQFLVGCLFSDRCPLVTDACLTERPSLRLVRGAPVRCIHAEG